MLQQVNNRKKRADGLVCREAASSNHRLNLTARTMAALRGKFIGAAG